MEPLSLDKLQGIVEDKEIVINGLSFHYHDWGASSPAMVVLHGATHHSRVWDTFASAMQHRYHARWSQRGHGESQWSTDYSDESTINDVEEFT